MDVNRKREVGLQNKNCDSNVFELSESRADRKVDLSETSVSDRGSVLQLCLYILQISVYISVHHQGAAAPQLHCKILSRPSHSTLTSLSQSGHRKHMRSSLLIGWFSVTHWMTADDVCFCLFWTISVSKCFLNVMMMSLWGAGPMGGGGGGGDPCFFLFNTPSLISSSFLRSSLKGLYRVQGLTWMFREGRGHGRGGVLWEFLD